jgi:hypothetical protein
MEDDDESTVESLIAAAAASGKSSKVVAAAAASGQNSSKKKRGGLLFLASVDVDHQHPLMIIDEESEGEEEGEEEEEEEDKRKKSRICIYLLLLLLAAAILLLLTAAILLGIFLGTPKKNTYTAAQETSFEAEEEGINDGASPFSKVTSIDKCSSGGELMADGSIDVGFISRVQSNIFSNEEVVCGNSTYNGGGSTSSSQGMWYTVEGTGGSFAASTCNEFTRFETQVTVFSGSCLDLVCVAGADNLCNESLVWKAEKGLFYFILVHSSSGGGTGTFGIELEEVYILF